MAQGLKTFPTSGSRGGGAPGARPPNGRRPMIFYAQNAIFSYFFPPLTKSTPPLRSNPGPATVSPYSFILKRVVTTLFYYYQ